MIESWGRGIEKIFSACAAAGCPKPLFQTNQGGLTLTFPEPAWLKDVAPEASGISQPQGLGTGLGKGLGKELDPTRQAIVQAMREDALVTTAMMAERLSLSTTAIENHIRFLRESGVIQRVGGRSAGHWEVRS